MPDSTQQTIGTFVENAAKLTRHGSVQYSDAGAAQSVTDVWMVYLKDPADRLDISQIDGLPNIGDAHSLSDGMELTGYRVREHEPGQLLREIECIYEANGVTESEGSGGSATEIGRVTALDWPAYTSSGDLASDQVDGTPVVNSAGDVFDSVPQYEETWIGVHFVRRVKKWPSDIIALAGTVNSAAITIYGVTFNARAGRLRVGCRYLFDGSERPYELDITVEPRHNQIDTNKTTIRPSGISGNYTSVGTIVDLGWDMALLDCGFQFKDDNDNLVRFTVIDENGRESAPQLPQLLDADGHDGRDDSHKSTLVVRTAPGNAWTALKAPTVAPSAPTSQPPTGD